MGKKQKEGDPEQQDTLAEWLFWRFRGQAEDGRWSKLPEESKLYWQHEAEAVRRAVKRGGFKNHDPEFGKEAETSGPTQSDHEAV